MEKYHTIKELQEMWKRTPQRQIAVAQTKILEAIIKSNGRVQLSWSGGKDSSFLLYLYCMVISSMDDYKQKPIDVVFADTTNESRGIYNFISYFPSYLEDKFGVKINLTTVKPLRNKKPVSMVSLVKDFGIPMLSKEVSSRISGVRKSMKLNNVSFSQIENHLAPTEENRDYLIGLGLNKTSIQSLIGWSSKNKLFISRRVIAKRWIPLLWDEAPDVSSVCCGYLKKGPINRIKYNGIQMTGEMAEESGLRLQKYLKTGCNGAILPDGTGKSKPLGAMTNQGLLYGIKFYEVPIAEDYGEIISAEGQLVCSKEQRTGCTLCGFGITYDWDRFIRLQKTEPAKIKFAFTPKEKGGLGYLEVCEFLNNYCKCKIQIPAEFRRGGLF